jgi:hypothetical protein
MSRPKLCLSVATIAIGCVTSAVARPVGVGERDDVKASALLKWYNSQVEIRSAIVTVLCPLIGIALLAVRGMIRESAAVGPQS